MKGNVMFIDRSKVLDTISKEVSSVENQIKSEKSLMTERIYHKDYPAANVCLTAVIRNEERLATLAWLRLEIQNLESHSRSCFKDHGIEIDELRSTINHMIMIGKEVLPEGRCCG
tara:strand:+ start:212 stop:556 length:345 start_codon:yes stop_codon:yes gene_type:complete